MSKNRKPAPQNPSTKQPVTELSDEERIARLVAEYEQRSREEFAKQPRTLHQIEMDVEDLGNAVKESVTKEVVDRAAPGYIGSRTVCECGAKAKFAGLRHRHLTTLHGFLAFEWAYYYCPSCRAGFCPTDHVLQIGKAECSRTVQAHIARVSSYLPFAQAAGELAQSRGLIVSATTVQHYAKKVGTRLGEAWDACQVQQMCAHLPFKNTVPDRLFAAMDGVKVHTDGAWHDAKLGVVYERDAQCRLSHRCFYGSFETFKQFGQRMRVLADANGATLCSDLQMLGDGAEWIWNETNKHFPKCIGTLYCYHLTDHLWDVAHAWFGQDTPQAAKWMQVQLERLHSDQPCQIIKEIVSWKPRSQTKQEIRRTTLVYLHTHRDRILYKTLRDNCYDIGSGIIEAGCKAVVKARLAGAGMRWNTLGASAILHLITHSPQHRKYRLHGIHSGELNVFMPQTQFTPSRSRLSFKI